nr:hypothetical protein [Tanacetum cinerariifolium]
MVFISSSNASSGKGEVHTASVPTASTQVSTASSDVAVASLSHDIVCFESALKDLNNLLGSQRLDKNKEGLGYNAVPPAQVYSPPKKDLSWTGLPEFVDDNITDYSRPTPSIESSCSIMSKPMIKFVKAADSPRVIKTNNIENTRKSTVKYAEMYRNTSKNPKVRGNQCNWNNLKSQQLGKDFLMQNKACFKCGYFDHLASECGVWVEKGKTRPKKNFAHKNVTHRAVLLKIGRTPIAVNRPNMNVAQPKITFFAKTTHSNVTRPFQRKSAVKTQSRVPRVSTVTGKIPTVDSKFSTAKLTFTIDLGNKEKAVKASACWIWRPKQNTIEQGLNFNGGNSQNNIVDKGYWDSGCSRHMTGNIFYLSEYEPYDGGYVSFGQGEGKITGKGIIKTSKLEFENVYFVKELKYNLFSVSQIYDNKNSILFTDSECIVLGKDFKLKDDTNVLLRTPRQCNMYSIDLNTIVPHKNLTCLVTKAFVDESMLWHRRLGHLNFNTMNKLVMNNLVKGLPSKCFENDHNCVACLKGKQHKASCKTKLVNSVSKPLHTFHMDLFGPTSISSLNYKWYCLVVTDDFSRFTWTFFLRTKDETSSILRNFITEIENLKDLKVKIIRCDNGGEFKNKEMNEFCTKKSIRREFSNARTPQQNRVAERRNMTLIEAARTMLVDAKLHVTFWDKAINTAWDEGYFVGYSMSSKAFRVFNKRTKKVEENLHVDFLENKLIEKGAGPNWLFDIDTLTNSMNYVPVVVAGTSSTNISKSSNSDAQDDCNADVLESSGISNPTATLKVPPDDQIESLTVESKIPTVSSSVPTVCLNISPESSSGSRLISKGIFSHEETPSLGNALTLSNRFEDTFGDTTNTVDSNDVEADLCNMESSIPASPTPTFRIHKDHPKSQIIGPVETHEEPKKIFDALKDLRVRPIGTKWVLKNKKDERGIVIRNKARLVAQGYTQEEGFDYEKVFAPVARIEAIRLFLAYASFMGFIVYHMDVKSTFLYGIIDEEVYVMQPLGFQDPEFPDRVYKVEKAMYGLHQAPKAWYVLQKKDGIFLSQDKYVGDILKKFGYLDVRSANTPMDKENPWGKDGPGKDVELHLYRSMIGSLIYLTASRPDIMFAVYACTRHQVTPKECHLYAVKRIFRYLKGNPKLGLWYLKESPFDLVAYSDNDYGGATQDRKSTTGGCQFLGKRLISWQCKKQTIVATSKTEAEYVAAASGCRQVLWIQNQMLDYGNFIMAKLAFCDYHNMIAILEKSDHNINFHQIVDFLKASHIRYALTISPTVYVSHIRQFWSTARIKTTNLETKILATVGEGSITPTKPHHTPSSQEQHSPHHDPSSPSHPTATTEPIPQTSIETPTKTPTLRRYTRRAIRIA